MLLNREPRGQKFKMSSNQDFEIEIFDVRWIFDEE